MVTVMATGTFDILHPGHALYLKKSKDLGGENAKLVVVVARDSTVRNRKRIPIIEENQRLEMIKYLKPVDEAHLGYNGDKFKIVKEINPDIITIGADQDFDTEKLEESLHKEGINAKVIQVDAYHTAELDSSSKIIKKIKESNFKEYV
ncbi:FAD synthase [uncultured Methanobrevibacter sp.]|uniref:FAD synthase n=1 Tax=uncultured Methanobrevibacter sp. TaxID=253161 RepID=UPI0025EFFDCD|nr:FAD synthase [uncultured Methanobrevibacter sp.]